MKSPAMTNVTIFVYKLYKLHVNALPLNIKSLTTGEPMDNDVLIVILLNL